ncbi:MAG: mutT 1 [Candidatus Saccharibacteria bacterium]|nr:mutT 1 [Candidatus Saccharibacteria bacterium]
MYNTATPYIAASVILRRENTVAFVLRAHTDWMNGFYDLPSGKVEQNERFMAAAVREAKEEAGVTVTIQNLSHAITVHRKAPDSQWLDVYFNALEWQGEPYNAEPDVHGELVWLDLDDLPKNVLPEIAEAFKQIKAGNTYAEYGWDASF